MGRRKNTDTNTDATDTQPDDAFAERELRPIDERKIIRLRKRLRHALHELNDLDADGIERELAKAAQNLAVCQRAKDDDIKLAQAKGRAAALAAPYNEAQGNLRARIEYLYYLKEQQGKA